MVTGNKTFMYYNKDKGIIEIIVPYCFISSFVLLHSYLKINFLVFTCKILSIA